MKKPSELFREAQKRALAKPYEAKFKKGDVIMNKAYGVVSLVVEITYMNNHKCIDLSKKHIIEFNKPLQERGYIEVSEPYSYELKDIKNEKTQKDITRKPSRYQQCQIIDKFYEQINPDMARLLYGIG